MAINKFLKFAKAASQIAIDKKARNVVTLNVRALTAVADYFVIATVDSTPQMKAVVDAIDETFKHELTARPVHREGKGSWSVLDYGGLLVHIMTEEARSFYALEKIWNTARKLKTKDTGR